MEETLEILRTKYLQSYVAFEGIHRRDILEYPFEALREAIINAIIHRDYQGFSQTQIRIYPDKMVIMNEGDLPPNITIEDLKKNHLSKPRNKLLAEVFYFAGLIEAWGRGTLKIYEKCREQGLPEPAFGNERGMMSVTFYKDKWNVIDLKELGLNERQIKAVMYVKKNRRITNREYREINDLSDEGARIDLNVLVEKHILIQAGKGRSIHYVLF